MVHICRCHHVRGMIYRFVTKFHNRVYTTLLTHFSIFWKIYWMFWDKFTSLVLSVKSVWLLRPCLIRPEPDPDFRSESYNSPVTNKSVSFLLYHCLEILSTTEERRGKWYQIILQITNICLFVAGIWVIYTERRKTYWYIFHIIGPCCWESIVSRWTPTKRSQWCSHFVSSMLVWRSISNKQSIGRWNEKPKRSCDIIHNTE